MTEINNTESETQNVADKTDVPNDTESQVTIENTVTPNESNSNDSSDSTDDQIVSEDYEDYGDSYANAAVDMLKEGGISIKEANDIFTEAVETGDFSKVKKDALVEKLGQSKAELVLAGVQTYYNNVIKTVQETRNAVYEEVGGEESYETVRKWARSKGESDPVFKAQLEAYNTMFDSGKYQAVLAAKELVRLYENDANNSSLTKSFVQGDKTSSTTQLSRSEYLTQVKAAHAKGDINEVKRLQNIRKQSIK